MLASTSSSNISARERSPLVAKSNKRKSNIFELSSDGSYRVSTFFAKSQSRSMDDLDKLEDKFLLREEHESQSTHSEENPYVGKSSDKKQEIGKDRNDNLDISDEEVPPPLYPRKRTTRLDSNYDTLIVPPNLARPSPSSRENVYNTVQITSRTASGNTQNGHNPAGNLKHRYANLDGDIPPSQHQQGPLHSSSGAYEEEPYDVLVTDRNTENINRCVDNGQVSDTTSVDTNIAGHNSLDTANTRFELRHSKFNNTYDTVTLRNSATVSNNGSTAGLFSEDNSHKTRIHSGVQDKTNGTSTVYEHHVPRRQPDESTVHGIATNVAPDSTKSRDLVAPPTLPPKTNKKDHAITSTQAATLPSLKSSSPVLARVQKYSPPVAPRIKKPPRTLPKPSTEL